MGYYIETEKPRNKANQIFDTIPGARIEPEPFFDQTGERVGVCVVENGPFDAAAIAFSEKERDAFARFDGRPRTWLSIPRAEAVKACPHIERLLPKFMPQKGTNPDQHSQASESHTASQAPCDSRADIERTSHRFSVKRTPEEIEALANTAQGQFHFAAALVADVIEWLCKRPSKLETLWPPKSH